MPYTFRRNPLRCSIPAVLGVLSAAVAVLAMPAGSSGAAASAAPVPLRFVGMTVDGPLFPQTAEGVDLNAQLGAMEAAGVRTIRVTFSWAEAQPYRRWSEVPNGYRRFFVDEHGVPTYFGETDTIVQLAAAHGLTVLPVVEYPPGWDVAPHRNNSFGRPAHNAPFGSYLTDLVGRYGPHGTLWSGWSGPTRPLPIREWQIWNEPNIPTYWSTQPFAATYVALLKLAAHSIRRADPSAKIVLAGLPNYSWKALETIYRIRGARAAFDVAAVHPYTATPSGVIDILRKFRAVMNANGDSRKPMRATEISWTSSKGKTKHDVGLDISTTEQGQARDIAELLPMLAADRRALGLDSFFYYTWATVEDPNGLIFSYAGLLRDQDGQFQRKPAYYAFEKAALKMEDCRTPAAVAPGCAKR